MTTDFRGVPDVITTPNGVRLEWPGYAMHLSELEADAFSVRLLDAKTRRETMRDNELRGYEFTE